MNKKSIIKAFTDLSTEIHKNNINKGFWEHGSTRNKPELLMLIVSELSEALEALRTDDKSDKLKDFTGLEEELADALIRILDMGAGLKLNLPEAILAKFEYNKSRPYKHNKKF